MNSTLTDSLRNLTDTATTLPYHAAIFDEAGNNLYTSSPNNLSSPAHSVISVITNLNNFTYPVNNNDSAIFLIKDYIDLSGDDFNNDTNYYYQKFFNYYAYDDGSAESQQGINVANSETAVQYDLIMADTLRGLQIYFNPTGYPVNAETFQICFWSYINVVNN